MLNVLSRLRSKILSMVLPMDTVGNSQGLRQGFYDRQKDSVMLSAQF